MLKRTKKHKTFGFISLSFVDDGPLKSSYYGGFFNYYYLKTRKSLNKKQIFLLDDILVGYPNGAAFFIKKTIWKKVNGYDDYLKFGGDDNDLGIKLWLGGYKNYLYSKTLQLHIGLPERQDDKKYSLKFKEMFYAHLYTIIKDYTIFNLFITFTGHSAFMFFKSIKQSIFRLNIGPFFAFFQGYYLFLKNLPTALKKRKEIQSKRVIREDVFLKIKPPHLIND